MTKKKLTMCPKCEEVFGYNNKDGVWDENSSYGSTKYVICPSCGAAVVVKVIEDSYDNNNDIRFVTYK